MNPTIQDRETRIRTDTRSPASSTRDSVTFSDPSGLPLTTAATAPPLRAVLRNPQGCHLLDQVPQTGLRHTWMMDQTSITAAGAIDTFLVLLIGIGPKIALVPFLEITASLDPPAKQRVLRKMLTTAAAVAVVLMVLGELLRALLHFTIGSLSIAGGVILLVLAVWMVLGPAASSSQSAAGKDPMQLAQFPLAVPYLLNPVGIVGLMTISAEAKSLSVFAVEFGILVFVLLLDVVVFRWANRVSDKLDESRMLVTEKVFGFLIAAIAVQLVLDGLSQVGVIGPVPH
jgi:small neutral amino acid transporter SnatA (MarC family)